MKVQRDHYYCTIKNFKTNQHELKIRIKLLWLLILHRLPIINLYVHTINNNETRHLFLMIKMCKINTTFYVTYNYIVFYCLIA